MQFFSLKWFNGGHFHNYLKKSSDGNEENAAFTALT